MRINRVKIFTHTAIKKNIWKHMVFNARRNVRARHEPIDLPSGGKRWAKLPALSWAMHYGLSDAFRNTTMLTRRFIA